MNVCIFEYTLQFQSLGLVRLFNVFEVFKVSYTHQGCIYPIKNTEKINKLCYLILL